MRAAGSVSASLYLCQLFKKSPKVAESGPFSFVPQFYLFFSVPGGDTSSKPLGSMPTCQKKYLLGLDEQASSPLLCQLRRGSAVNAEPRVLSIYFFSCGEGRVSPATILLSLCLSKGRKKWE